ncbi:MAG: hypothetical protein D6809_00970 [Gammaproteobacteria bacterium]|nr:MAG: hypothetical protein D6809_00970 [Gammaproteobacteria bacterium]
MTVPLSPRTVGLFLACGTVLPFAAFFAAYPFERSSHRRNVLSAVIGVLTILLVGVVLYLNT